jgi:hypothetical protein
MTATFRPVSELIKVEQHQLYLFLTEIRSVGEEKSDLFPEPQYFTASFASAGANMPYVVKKIIARCGDGARWGRRCKRVLSQAGGVQLPGIPWIVNWAREMLLLEKSVPGRRPGVVFDDGDVIFKDADVGACMRFAIEVVEQYRSDGQFYPSPTSALGSNFRILSAADAQAIAVQTKGVDSVRAREVLGLMAAIRALSFLMESETREALMVHGPYPMGDDGHQLIVFECSDLHWSLWPNFPLSGGARWVLPEQPFPIANLAIAMVLRDVDIKADRIGTLYIEPLNPENVVSASLLTRGTDEFRDDGLTQIDLSEARLLRRRCDDIQATMFLQLAEWDSRQRMEAGVRQEETLLLRMLASAGFTRSEIESEQKILSLRHEQVWGPNFDSIMATPSDQLPFFKKLGRFAAGEISDLYSPLVLTPDEDRYEYPKSHPLK